MDPPPGDASPFELRRLIVCPAGSAFHLFYRRGHDGGRIVFEGTPADLVAARATLTGEHLAQYAEG